MPVTFEPPLCVDLDGTLIAGDTLVISIGLASRKRPLLLAGLPFVLLRGRPAFKRFLAERVLPAPATLPWRPEVVEFVRQEHATGREIWLVTAADRLVAESVSEHLGLFHRVIATDGGANLKSENKLAAIRNMLSNNEFDYIGDSLADLPVFGAARYAYLVAPTRSLRKALESRGRVRRVFTA